MITWLSKLTQSAARGRLGCALEAMPGHSRSEIVHTVTGNHLNMLYEAIKNVGTPPHMYCMKISEIFEINHHLVLGREHTDLKK